MKKLLFLAVAATMLAGCGMMQNSSNGQTAQSQTTSQTAQPTTVQSTQPTSAQATPFSSGQGAGNALLSLYNQYKADGKYDYTNMQNIINTLSLVASCEGLKNNYKDTSYLKEFGTGMIASSLGLVTQNNVETVTTSLVDMVKNNETVQNTSAKVQNAANTTAQYASALSALLSAFASNNE